MGWEVEERFKRNGTYVSLGLINADLWQKPKQHCNTIILQLKINKFLKRNMVLNFLIFFSNFQFLILLLQILLT